MASEAVKCIVVRRLIVARSEEGNRLVLGFAEVKGGDFTYYTLSAEDGLALGASIAEVFSEVCEDCKRAERERN